MKQFLIKAIDILNHTQKEWGKVFVNLKMEFCRKYQRGLITSTIHGADFFSNLLNCIENKTQWDEKGEYGENFRKLIKMGRENP